MKNLSFSMEQMQNYCAMKSHCPLSKSLFIFAHNVGEKKFYQSYKTLLQSQWKSYRDQKENQEKELKCMINFVYKYVPYYNKIFKQLKLEPSYIKTIEDLEKLPILTKDVIKYNWEDFKPINLNSSKYFTFITSGSTGAVFQYRLSNYDRFFSGAMMYRGWGYAGYELGDKIVTLGGSALGIRSTLEVKDHVVAKARDIATNIRRLSTFDMNTEDLLYYVRIINSLKPKFIRGYASSINLFAKFILENDIDVITPKAIFTTAEKLMPYMRKNIEEVFGCEVYDNYGLNDGGVSAYECFEHDGLHIDTERSIMEIVDDDHLQLECGVGKILATSLHNYSMPFIRYDTGDMGYIISDVCACGRESRLLKEIVGRTVDFLLTPEGKIVNGHYFLFILEKTKGIKEYQIVQNKINKLVIKVVPNEKFNEAQMDTIKKLIRRKSYSWEIEIKCVKKIMRTEAGKYKYLICNL